MTTDADPNAHLLYLYERTRSYQSAARLWRQTEEGRNWSDERVRAEIQRAKPKLARATGRNPRPGDLPPCECARYLATWRRPLGQSLADLERNRRAMMALKRMER